MSKQAKKPPAKVLNPARPVSARSNQNNMAQAISISSWVISVNEISCIWVWKTLMLLRVLMISFALSMIWLDVETLSQNATLHNAEQSHYLRVGPHVKSALTGFQAQCLGSCNTCSCSAKSVGNSTLRNSIHVLTFASRYRLEGYSAYTERSRSR